MKLRSKSVEAISNERENNNVINCPDKKVSNPIPSVKEVSLILKNPKL